MKTSSNGNGQGIWEVSGKRHRTSKKVRLTGRQREAAERDGGGSLSSRLIAEMERRIGKQIKCKGKEWFVYNGVKWERVEKDCFRPIARDVQELANRNHRRTVDLVADLEDFRQLRVGEQFYGAMRVENGSYLLNFLNGTLKIDRETGEILDWLKHIPEHMFTLSLGNYVADSDCLFFKKVLREILPCISDRKLLLNIACTALLPDSRFEVALFCVGRGANGKSVITEALMNALGKDVCSALTLHQICGNEPKHMFRLQNKMLNVATETETDTITNTSTFKNVISGEIFEATELYRKDGFSMQTTCKFMFLMNDMPLIRHANEADWRRCKFLYFPVHFSEENRDTMLRDKLRAEAEGILAYLVRRLPRLCALDEIPQGSFASRKVEENFQGRSDIVALFFNQCLEITCHPKPLAKANIYLIFKRFCKMRDHKSLLGESQFFKIARRLFPESPSGIDWNYRHNAGKMGIMYSVRGFRLSELGFQLLSV